MAKIIQLSLNFAGACAPAPAVQMCAADSVCSDTCADYDAMALRQGIDFKPVGPCKSCPLRGLCDPDDCGMLGFHIDSSKAGQGSWDSYFERQRARVHSWLESHPLTL